MKKPRPRNKREEDLMAYARSEGYKQGFAVGQSHGQYAGRAALRAELRELLDVPSKGATGN